MLATGKLCLFFFVLLLPPDCGMASSPSSRHPRRGRPGCMGGIAHLFDVNPALAGRKLIMDMQPGGACQASTGDMSSSMPPIVLPMTRRDEGILYVHKETTLRASPIAALRAHDVSMKGDAKKRSPSVIARLMGLDALPSNPKVVSTPQNTSEVEGFTNHMSLVRQDSMGTTVPKGVHNASHSTKGPLRHEVEASRLSFQSLPDCSHMHESREIHDAMKFLQSNKEFFIRFLKDPDSVRLLQHNDTDAAPEKSIYSAIEAELCQSPDTYLSADENYRDQATIKDPRVPRRIRSGKHRSEENLSQGAILDPLLGNDSAMLSFLTQNHLEHIEENEAFYGDCSIPTRIVVLKPSPGRPPHNFKPLSSNYLTSRESNTQIDNNKEVDETVLRDIREILMKEFKETLNFGRKDDSGEVHRGVKDPKLIAREIARRVREQVLRDLVANQGTKVETRKMADFFRDDGDKAIKLELHNVVLEKRRDFGARHSVDGSGNKHSGSFTGIKVPGSVHCSNVASVGMTAGRNEEGGNDSLPKVLMRSRSLPAASADVNNSWVGKPELNNAGNHELNVKKTSKEKIRGANLSNSSKSNNAISSADVAPRRSIFSKKMLGWKGSLFVSRKHASTKEEHIETPYPADVCSSNQHREEDRHGNKEDWGMKDAASLISTTSSSIALSDHFSSSRSKIAAAFQAGENKIESDDPFKDNIQNFPNILHSPLASPKRSSCATEMGMNERIGSSVNKVQCEQPSPISVLDVAFQEEEASPMNFEKISSGLKELRMRLELLKFVDQEPMVRGEDIQALDNARVRDEAGQSVERILSELTTTLTNQINLDKEDSPKGCLEARESFDWLLDDIDCPKQKREELQYVRDVLVASGFTGDNLSIFTRWYAPSQPLDPSVFARLEDGYRERSCEFNKCGELMCERAICGMLDFHSRHLLFDSVNEALLHVLGPRLKNDLGCMPSKKDLLRSVWVAVNEQVQPRCQDSLGNLVTKDLMKKDQWCNIRSDTEAVVLHVERAIFDDLLDETLLVL